MAAEERKSGRWERQTVKLEKQVSKLKEEKTELKKQVVGPGKVVVSEKIYTRQKAQLAACARLRKSDAVKEHNAKAMVPYRDDLAQIKEMAAELERQKTAEAGGTAGEVKLAAKVRNDMGGFAEEAEMEDLVEHSTWLAAVCEDRDELENLAISFEKDRNRWESQALYYERLFKYEFQIRVNSGVPGAAVQLEECVDRRRRGAADADVKEKKAADQWECVSRDTLQGFLEQSAVGIKSGLERDGFKNWQLTASELGAQRTKWTRETEFQESGHKTECISKID